MSDKENTATDANKKNQTESSDTESSTQNFVIPLVLLLVSGIVIVATFYQDEYSDMLASSDSRTTLSEDTSANETFKAGNTESDVQLAASHDAKTESANKTSENITVAAIETQTSTITNNALSAAADDTTAKNTIDEDNSASVADADKSGQKPDSINETNKAQNTPLDKRLAVSREVITESADKTSENFTAAAETQTSTITSSLLSVTTDKITADKNPIAENNSASVADTNQVADANQSEQKTDSIVAMHSMPAINDADTAPVQHQHSSVEPNQPNDAVQLNRKLTYEQSKARAQQQAKQRHEMMQQRRQAHAKEIQSRRQQYEVAMKAREEKRVQIIDTRKALHKRVQQNRLATKQTREEAHKRIAELHEEIHQIMKQSLYKFKRPVVTQTKKIDVEHM